MTEGDKDPRKSRPAPPEHIFTAIDLDEANGVAQSITFAGLHGDLVITIASLDGTSSCRLHGSKIAELITRLGHALLPPDKPAPKPEGEKP